MTIVPAPPRITVAKRQKGFTLVELLIVIVVIAILAAITIVAYNGVTGKAHISAIEGTLTQNKQLIEDYNAENGSYPADQASAGLKTGSGITLTYSLTDDGYCLQADGWTLTYRTTPDSSPTEGSCAEAPPSSDTVTWFPDTVPSLPSLTEYDFSTSGFIEALQFTASGSTQAISWARYGAPASLAGASVQFLLQTGNTTSRATVATSGTVTLTAGWNEVSFPVVFVPTVGTTYWLEAVVTGSGGHYYGTSGDGGVASASGYFTTSASDRWYITSTSNPTGPLIEAAGETIPSQFGYAPNS